MRLSVNWLADWLNTDKDTDAIATGLTRLGLEVDFVEPAAPSLDRMVVAHVVSAEQHPQADRLRLCKVDAGPQVTPEGPVDVVCGAPNARTGIRVALAVPGSRLPDGTKLRKSRIRGVVSNGMLCSISELGLGEEHDGILELDSDAPVGTSLSDYLALDDQVIEIDLTPDRGDCNGVLGLARDLAASGAGTLTAPDLTPVPATIDDTFDVQLDAPEACPYFASRVLRDVDAATPTPDWLVERLRRAGVRSISLVVDVTNYVMLDLNQPMHAYDLTTLSGGIKVRHASQGEQVLLLDGTEPALDERTLVIADHEKALGIGGVMGGQDSGVSHSTRDVLLECAWFNPREVGVTSRRLGLLTDAAYRFARGSDTAGQVRAIERATRLILDVAGGSAGPVSEARDDARLPVPSSITLRASRIERLLGVSVDGADVERILDALGCDVKAAGAGQWDVLPPTWRSDLALEADLIEEVARMHGYEAIPALPMRSDIDVRPSPESLVPLSASRSVLVERGYQEAVTYAFVSEETTRLLQPDATPVPLDNAMSSEMGVMRTSLWPGLLGALRYNLNRQQKRVRLFETGLVFNRVGGAGKRIALEGLEQRRVLGGVACGSARPEQWSGGDGGVGFFEVKSDIEALLAGVAPAGGATFVAASHPALHPGQCARIDIGGEPVGWLGALHPAHAAALDIDAQVFVFEIDAAALEHRAMPGFVGLSRFPSVRRDIAMVVDETHTAAELAGIIGGLSIDVLKTFVLFDVYRGKGVDSGRKSLAFGLHFQHLQRTLEDDEVDAAMNAIFAALEKEVGAERRL